MDELVTARIGENGGCVERKIKREGAGPMKQELLTIQIGRRIVLREARRMRDPMRRRTSHGSWPTLDKLLLLAIFCDLAIPVRARTFARKHSIVVDRLGPRFVCILQKTAGT